MLQASKLAMNKEYYYFKWMEIYTGENTVDHGHRILI